MKHVIALKRNISFISLFFVFLVGLTIKQAHSMDLTPEERMIIEQHEHETAQEQAFLHQQEEDDVQQALALSRLQKEQDPALAPVLHASWEALSTPQKIQNPWAAGITLPYTACDEQYQTIKDFFPTTIGHISVKQLPVLYQGYTDLRKGFYQESNMCGYYALYNATQAAHIIINTHGLSNLEERLLYGLNDRTYFEREVLAPATHFIQGQRAPCVNYHERYGNLTAPEIQTLTLNGVHLFPRTPAEVVNSIIIIDEDGLSRDKTDAIQTQCQRLFTGSISVIPFIIFNHNHWIAAALTSTNARPNTCDLYVFDSLAHNCSQEPLLQQLITTANQTFAQTENQRRHLNNVNGWSCKNIVWLLLGSAALASSLYYF